MVDINEAVFKICDKIELSIIAMHRNPSNSLDFELSLLCKSKGQYEVFADNDENYNLYPVNERMINSVVSFIRTTCEDRIEEILPLCAERIIKKYVHLSWSNDIQPIELTNLVLSLVKDNDCKVIYNPFAGLASYAMESHHRYYGQEINTAIYNIAKMRLDLHGIDCPNYTNEDSIRLWDEHGADCIVSTPPFGLRLHPEIRSEHHVSTFDEYLIKRFLFGKAQFGIFVMPRSFCNRNSSITMGLRNDICNYNMLDMVINLPSGIFSSTGLSTSIIVLNRYREKHDDIVFVDAESLVSDNRREKIINTQAVLSSIKDANNEYHYQVKLDDLYRKNCSFDAARYFPQNVNKTTGQKVIPLGDVLHLVSGVRNSDNLKEIANIVRASNFTDNIIHIEDATYKDFIDEHMVKYHGPHMAINRMGKIYIHKGDTDFYVNQNERVFTVDESIVDPEYLALCIFKNPLFHKRVIMRGGIPRIDMDMLMEFQIAIDDPAKQKQIVRKAKSDYLASEKQRLGIREAGGDLSHMLGMPKDSIGNLISCLLLSDNLSAEDKEMVKAIDDNFKYTLRLVNIVGADFSTMSVSSHIIPVADLIRDYVNSIKNLKFSNNYSIVEEIMVSDSVTINCDEDMIRVMLDSAFRNAYKHGFGQEYSESNIVKLGCRVVEYDGNPYVCFTIANNGKALAPGFTIQDFATRGKKAGKTGNSGKGGFHIYSIAKKYNGYINISSSQEWPFILDILIPAENIDDFNITEVYEDECL